MTRSIFIRSLVALSLAWSLGTSAAAQQSLGEAARQVRKNKPSEPTTKVITNDDLSSNRTRVSADGSGPNSGEGENQPKPAEATGNDTAKAEAEKAKTEEEKAKEQSLPEKISAERDKTTKLQGDIATLQEQIKQRASNYYGDAGTRLRDPKKYADDVQHDKDQLAAKQKELEEAKTKLGQLEDESRKSDQQ